MQQFQQLHAPSSDLPHRDRVFVCAACHQNLTEVDDALACIACSRRYERRGGFIDFAPDIARQPGLGQAFMETRRFVKQYESRARPNFMRLMGRNWNGSLTASDEDQYLRTHIAPVKGPVLDLACGAGRWTQTVADIVGVDRVVGLDLSMAMLQACQRTLPDLRCVRGSALALPFADGSLGAVNLSNALQVIPEPQRVIEEVGRCLRVGGTFTCLTYRRANTLFYGLLQRTFSWIVGVQAFREADLRAWVESAGMEVVDMSGPRLILLLTARRIRRD